MIGDGQKHSAQCQGRRDGRMLLTGREMLWWTKQNQESCRPAREQWGRHQMRSLRKLIKSIWSATIVLHCGAGIGQVPWQCQQRGLWTIVSLCVARLSGMEHLAWSWWTWLNYLTQSRIMGILAFGILLDAISIILFINEVKLILLIIHQHSTENRNTDTVISIILPSVTSCVISLRYVTLQLLLVAC